MIWILCFSGWLFGPDLQIGDLHLKTLTRDSAPDQELAMGYLGGVALGDGQSCYLLDREEKVIRVIDASGKQIQSFGRPGQGPGEFLDPVALWRQGNELWVLDGRKALIIKFALDGSVLDQTRLMPGYGGLFFSGGVLVQTVLKENLFHYFDSTGKLVREFGESIAEPGRILEAMKELSHCAVDEKSNLFFEVLANGDRLRVYNLRSGELTGEYDPNLIRFALRNPDRQVQSINSGKGLTLRGNQPVKGVVVFQGRLLILVHDENEEGRSLIAAYGPRGENLGAVETPHFYWQMYLTGEVLHCFNRDEASWNRYRLTPTKKSEGSP